MVEDIQTGPNATLVASTEENEEPERGHDKAEDWHEHYPAL